jgi:hypothetical protein
MPGGKEIKAGAAYVELKVLDTVGSGLRNVGSKLKAFGAGVTSIGVGLAAAGAVGLAPFLAAVNLFSDMGADLLDMSQKTGISVEALSALGFAASQSGSSAEELGAGIRNMQKNLTGADEDSKKAQKSLAFLGLTAQELEGLTPDEQFRKIAAALVAIEDPARQTKIAMDVFGKSGQNLLPTMKDLENQLARHDQLGLGWTTEEAESAEAFGDVMGELWAVLKKGVAVIGGSLVPALSPLLKMFTAPLW